jgi:hypothetical protein
MNRGPDRRDQYSAGICDVQTSADMQPSALLAALWRARLAITAVVLAVSAAVIIRGHHDAWAGDTFYKASLKDDLGFAACTAAAFGAAWAGAYSPAYLLCLNLVFFYQGVLNVVSLLGGDYVIKGSHGCFACIESATQFVWPDYAFAGLLATVMTRLIAARFGSSQTSPARVQADVAMAMVLIAGWFQVTFFVWALNQPQYVMAQLTKLAPYVVAAIMATIGATWMFNRFGAYEPPPHVAARIVVAAIFFIVAPLLPLFL